MNIKPAKTKSTVVIPTDETPAHGKIVTFYSYKGGTGRSMALANAAWILASQGQRVLVIDWDLEAPGLHRYYCPFLEDSELIHTNGLIDFFSEFVNASRVIVHGSANSTPKASWFQPYTDLLRYAIPVDYEFEGKGCIDFVPAGRQGPAYGLNVGNFQWTEFYNSLGGGIFLEAVKQRLRNEYDYILIDSRTGLSDTSGICTVQMPDELVVFFTLNRQSVEGASSAAKSVTDQRKKPNGSPGMKIWPIPTRIDDAEKERLEIAREYARNVFSPYLWHLSRKERVEFWGMAEVPYQAFYAYEEILATIADSPDRVNSLLASMERLVSRISGGSVSQLKALPQIKRHELLKLFIKESPTTQAQKQTSIYISYSRRDMDISLVKAVIHRLESTTKAKVFWDELVLLGESWAGRLRSEISRADLVLFFVGPAWMESKFAKEEMALALGKNRRTIPILISGRISFAKIPAKLRDIKGLTLDLSAPNQREESLNQLVNNVRRVLQSLPSNNDASDPDDPQKGKWGGLSSRNGRVLTAKVSEESADWFEIILSVRRTSGAPLAGKVTFYLHPTYENEIEKVDAKNGQAKLRIWAYGAFTVGALLDDERTSLELDLAKIPGVPKKFAER